MRGIQEDPIQEILFLFVLHILCKCGFKDFLRDNLLFCQCIVLDVCLLRNLQGRVLRYYDMM